MQQLLYIVGAKLPHASNVEVLKNKNVFNSKQHLFIRTDFSNPDDIELNFKKIVLDIKFDIC